MVRRAASVLFFLFIFSCSGYFQDDKTDGDRLQPLALAGGGYLSSDTADDITPFVYRNSVNGKTYLFFASDRDGNMDIFYAEMDSEGKFSAPAKLDSTINTAASEFSPIVYFTNAYHILSFIRISNTTTNMISYHLNNSYVASFADGTPFSSSFLHISLIPVIGGVYAIYAAIGTTNVLTYTYSGSSMPVIFSGASFNVNFPIRGIAGYPVAANNFNLLLNKTDNQFTGMNKNSTNNIYFNTPLYGSPFQDSYPFVDPVNYKVYFASTRYGTYDLFRYNLIKFNKIVP